MPSEDSQGLQRAFGLGLICLRLNTTADAIAEQKNTELSSLKKLYVEKRADLSANPLTGLLRFGRAFQRRNGVKSQNRSISFL